MAKEKATVDLTVSDARAIIAEQKITVREMEWVPKKTASNPQWVEFVSACRVKSEIREDVMFRAQFRPARNIVMGDARIVLSEIFNAALCVGPHRILALDSEDTPHKNKRGLGLPYYRQTLTGRTHLHLWTDEGYGYVEPIEPPILSVELLVADFLPRANLTLLGIFRHPLQGAQLGLDI